MKKINTLKASFVLILIGVFSLTTSCSSDNSNNEESSTIFGKWNNYKRVEYNITYTDISDLKALPIL